MKSMAQVAADFDAIAAALAGWPPPDRLGPAERWLLSAIPDGARTGLDAGCGDGRITRAAAARGLRMLGIDVSPGMVTLARSRTRTEAPVVFQTADILTADLEAGTFDVVISINLVHHLPFDAALSRLARLVAPGGRLLIQDVVSRPGLRYLPLNLWAATWRSVRETAGGDRMPRVLRRLYQRHGAGERYLTPTAAAVACAAVLPGARLAHHLEWRYSVVWSPAPGTRQEDGVTGSRAGPPTAR